MVIRIINSVAAVLLTMHSPVGLAAPRAALAQSPVEQTAVRAPADAHAAAPAAVAVRATGELRIDGRLTEAAWEAATPISDFTQMDPEEGEPASEATEARILFDDDALYVGVRLSDTGPVTARLGRRDMPMSDSDWVTVILDSYHDHQTAYGFELNPAGVRRDQTRAGDGEDSSWEPVWDAAATVDEGGWTAEMRIPFSQLRFTPTEQQTWGLQIERTIGRKNEFSVFSFTPKSDRGGIARFGHLTGLRDLRPGRRLEALPYVVARADRVDRGDNPFRADASAGAAMGLDLKYRITSNLTLNATLNPDFGQVEVDPAVVNLSAFETFYEEKRPFFVEGSSIFDFASSAVGPGSVYRNLFYSRRIGRAPQLRAPSARADVPDATTILGAAKLTGRTASGWSTGVLAALTERERSRYLLGDGTEGLHVVEPQTGYLVARGSREMRAGQSAVGGMLTAVHRDLETEYLDAGLRSDALSGGLDFRHEWARRAWRVSGFATGSRVHGTPEVLTRLQRSSARYFHRPDADHLALDPATTALGGYAGQLQVRRQAGRHWRGDAAVYAVSPGYEINDLGFQSRADQLGTNLQLIYVENQPGPALRTYRVSSFVVGAANFGGEAIQKLWSTSAFGQLRNYWSGVVGYNRVFRSWDDRLTRGGPLAVRPAGWEVVTSISSDQRRSVTAGFFGSRYRDEEGGAAMRLRPRIGIKPSSRWNLTLGPELYRTSTPAQFVMSVPDSLASGTFGRRYVFAELEQTTLSLDTRLNVTFTPELTLELYAQPFLAAGDFSDYKEFAAPRSHEFQTYGREIGAVEGRRIDPDGAGPAAAFDIPDARWARDFNLRSLRGNAVLRWEWRPGSTLYLAWQQSRAAEEALGDFQFGRDTHALLTQDADNVLVLKVNYWLNP